MRIELTTSALQVRCSTTKLIRHILTFRYFFKFILLSIYYLLFVKQRWDRINVLFFNFIPINRGFRNFLILGNNLWIHNIINNIIVVVDIVLVINIINNAADILCPNLTFFNCFYIIIIICDFTMWCSFNVSSTKFFRIFLSSRTLLSICAKSATSFFL